MHNHAWTHTHTGTCTHMDTHIHAHTVTHPCTQTCMHTNLYTHTCLHPHTHAHTQAHILLRLWLAVIGGVFRRCRGVTSSQVKTVFLWQQQCSATVSARGECGGSVLSALSIDSRTLKPHASGTASFICGQTCCHMSASRGDFSLNIAVVHNLFRPEATKRSIKPFGGQTGVPT